MPVITENYRAVLSAVVEESEVPESVILSSCRKSEALDARYVLVHCLHRRYGLYPSRISALTGICERSINYIITYYENRAKQSNYLRSVAAAVYRKLGIGSEANGL